MTRALRDVSFLVFGLAEIRDHVAQRLISELDDVWVARETHFWTEYAITEGIREDQSMEHDAACRLVRGMVDPEVRVGLTQDEVAAVLQVVPSSGLTAWELFELIIDALSPPGPQVLGEKTPAHMARGTQLLGARPDLRVIGLVRDPRPRSRHT